MKKWLKREKKPISELGEHPCLNCDHVFAGHFCPNCGQSVGEFDRPFGFVFYDFLGNIVAFDSRLFKTIFGLVFKPGFLTVEFFRGKRMSYAPPFRVFIFLSFLLFLVLQIASNRSLRTVLDHSLQDGIAEIDSTSMAVVDSVGTELREELVKESEGNFMVDMDLKDFLTQDNIRTSLHQEANRLEKKLAETEDPGKRKDLIRIIDICRSPSQLVAKILKYLSWAFFVLLPVFALLLKLFYIRRRRNYIRHLVFSVHLHSFMFLLFFVVVSVNLVFGVGAAALINWSLLIFPFYAIVAMRKFYKQSWRKTIVKSLLLGFLYNMSVLTAFVLVVMNAYSDIY